MYEILFKWGLETFRGAVSDASKEELAFALEAAKTKNKLVERRFDQARRACDDLIELSLRLDREIEAAQDSVHDGGSEDLYSRFVGKLRNDLHPSFLRQYRKLKGRFMLTNDLLAGYSLITTEIVQYRQFSHISKSLGLTKVSESASLYRALWEHLIHLLTTMTRLSSNDVRFWLTDRPYMQNAELFAAQELKLARDFFLEASHGYYRCLLEEPSNLECFWSTQIDGIVNTYAQPSITTIAMSKFAEF